MFLAICSKETLLNVFFALYPEQEGGGEGILPYEKVWDAYQLALGF